MKIVSALRGAFVIFLLFPFLILLTQFRWVEGIVWPEMLWAFKNSFIQAFFSALASLVLGFWVSLGLLSLSSGFKKRFRTAAEILCLLPNFLPPLFILLATLNVIDPFPMGLTGVVLIHSLMNFGVVAVLLTSAIENKMGGMIELAYVEGASRGYFIRRGLFPQMRSEIFSLGLFIFVVCFGSFSVPLIVGGGKGTTVEVLIYEKIRLSTDWGSAVVLALLQSSFIFLISWIVKENKTMARAREVNLNLLQSPTGLIALAVVSAIYIYGYFEGLWGGLQNLTLFYDLQSSILWSFLGTLVMSLTVGLLTYCGLLLIAYCWPVGWFERFLTGYVAPSTSLACFALLIVGPNEGLIPFFKIPVAFVMLSLNTLYRMGWDSHLKSLEAQRTLAYSMGASSRQIFWDILFPQISVSAGRLAGIASVWVCGDFAVSRILAHRDLTLAMMTETLMSGYRLHQAMALSLLVILSGVLCFFICVGGSRVLSRKFTT